MNLLDWALPKKYVTAQMEPTCRHQPEYRGFMLDSARCQENRAYYRNAIDFAAQRGMSVILWHFTDDQGCSLEFDAVPELASPNAYSKSEMRELVRYASDRGIQIVPELASLGHCRYLTRLPAYRHLNETDSHFTGMCPVSRETRSIIAKVIKEAVEVFDSPNFHVGMDEVNIGEHPLTQAALQSATKADLLVDYIQFLHATLSSHGKRLWMWGDMLLKYPQMLPRIAGDIVICNWQYAPDVSTATTQTLLDAGFDVMLFSALISHDQTLFPGEKFALPNIRNLQTHVTLAGIGKVIGHLTTIWTPVRFIAHSLWVAMDFTAAILRGEEVDSKVQAARFGHNFYGLTAESSAPFAQAVGIVFEHSPLRKQWLAVAKIQSVPADADAWSRAQELLLIVADSVQHHVEEFNAFRLLVDLLAQTDAAAECVTHDLSSAELTEIITRGEEIIARLDQAWDCERFADDPRKFTASHAHFQDDHLIPLLHTGLATLKKKLEQLDQAAENVVAEGVAV